MRFLRFVLLALLASFNLQNAWTQTAPPFQFHFTEAFGPHAIGLKVESQSDPSRPFKLTPPGAEIPRPLQTLVWYPAQPSKAPVMTLGDYGALVKTETSSIPMEHGKSQDFMVQYVHGTESLPMRAIRDAAIEPGRFPVIVYAPSLNATNTENIELCEYLASYGYIVLASPSLGSITRVMINDQAGADAQAQDIAYLLQSAKTLPDADTNAKGVIGYSWGGNAGLTAVAHNSSIRALVALDPSFQFDGNPIPPGSFAVPLLIFSHGADPLAYRDNGARDIDSTVLRQWKSADLLHIEMLAMAHLSFSSLFQRSERFRAEALHFTPADYSLEEGAESYNCVVLYTRNFLDAYLKHDRNAQAFLRHTPVENGIPRHLVAIDFRAATSVTPEK